MAEYITSCDIQDEPVFAWWVPYTLRKRDRIIASVKSRVCKSSHKYGIEILTLIKHAEDIDHRNKNTFWQDAIKYEMSNIGVEFKILETGESPPPGYTNSSGHIVFDVRMSFQRKSWWVKDGHRTPDPDTPIYEGVLSREIILILVH